MLVVGYKRTRTLEGSWAQKAEVLDGGKIVCSVEWRKAPGAAVTMTTHCMNGGRAEEIDLCRLEQQGA